jgi:hypothetical protein
VTVAFLHIYKLYIIHSGASIQAFLYTNTSPSEGTPYFSLHLSCLHTRCPLPPPHPSALRSLFKELLHNGAKEVREKDSVEVPELDVRKYDVVNDELYPKLEDVDAVLLSGSREFCSFLL